VVLETPLFTKSINYFSSNFNLLKNSLGADFRTWEKKPISGALLINAKTNINSKEGRSRSHTNLLK